MIRDKRHTEQRLNIDIQLCRISVSWTSVLFPFEQWKLFQLLPENGYILNAELQRTPSFGSRIELDGLVGTKGSIRLGISTSRRQIWIEGLDIQGVLQEFSLIEELLGMELSFDSGKNHDHYEIDVQALIWTERSPAKAVSHFWQSSPHLDRLANAVGRKCTIYGLRLAEAGKTVIGNDWFDIQLEPSNRGPESCYVSHVVFRNPERDAVIKMAESVHTQLESLVRLLESAP